MKNSSYRKLHIGRILPGILIFLMVVAAVGSSIATAADEIRIGFTTAVTGVLAAMAAPERKAIQFALKQINAAGGVNGKKINLIVVDAQSTIPGALAAVQKAVEQEQVLALISFLISPFVLATSDAIKSYGIPAMIGGTHVSLTRQGNPWLFRVRPDDSITALAMVKYIDEDMKLRRIGILHDSNVFGTGGADLVEQGAKERGMTIVRREKYTTGERDYTARLLSLKGYQGVLGTFSFTPNGDGLHEVSIVQIEQGKPKLLKYVSVEAK